MGFGITCTGTRMIVFHHQTMKSNIGFMWRNMVWAIIQLIRLVSMVTDWWFDFHENYDSYPCIYILDIIDTRGNFEVDIFDLIDVRGDLPDSVRMNQIRNFPTQQQTSYPKTFAKFSTPKGLEFRVEGNFFLWIMRFFTIFHSFSFPEKPGDVLNNVKIFIFSPKHIIKSDKFIESHLTRDANGVWICSLPDVALNLDDNIEYWIYAEKSNLGYFTNHISAVQGNCCL